MMGVPIGQWLDGVKFNITCPACKRPFEATIGFLRRNRGIITPCRNCGAGIKLDSGASLMEIDNYLNDYARHLKEHKKMPKRKFMSKIGVSLVNADSDGGEGDLFDEKIYEAILKFMFDAMRDDAKSGFAITLAVLNKTSRNSDIRIAGPAKASAYGIFLALVLNNWDYKPRLRDNKTLGLIKARVIKSGGIGFFNPIKGDDTYLYFYDIWGNIHYGYVGKAVGFSDDELIGGSQIHDAVKGRLSLPESANDTLSIITGIELFKKKKFRLTINDLESAIDGVKDKWSVGIVRYLPSDLEILD